MDEDPGDRIDEEQEAHSSWSIDDDGEVFDQWQEERSFLSEEEMTHQLLIRGEEEGRHTWLGWWRIQLRELLIVRIRNRGHVRRCGGRCAEVIRRMIRTRRWQCGIGVRASHRWCMFHGWIVRWCIVVGLVEWWVAVVHDCWVSEAMRGRRCASSNTKCIYLYGCLSRSGTSDDESLMKNVSFLRTPCGIVFFIGTRQHVEF